MHPLKVTRPRERLDLSRPGVAAYLPMTFPRKAPCEALHVHRPRKVILTEYNFRLKLSSKPCKGYQ